MTEGKGKSEFNEVVLPILGFKPGDAVLMYQQKLRLKKVMKETGWDLKSPQMVYLVGVAFSAQLKSYAEDQFSIRRIDRDHHDALLQRAKNLERAARRHGLKHFGRFWLRQLRDTLFMSSRSYRQGKVFEAALVSLAISLPPPKQPEQ